ncbi:MAG: hypothetical protein AAFQ41_02275 [Cyanobacteria bacterium J06623_7]
MFLVDEFLRTLEPRSRFYLVLVLGVALLSIPISLAAIAINGGTIQFKNASTEINLKGNAGQLANDAQYSTNETEFRLRNLESKIERLAKERPRDPLIKETVQEFAEFKPTAKEQLQNSEQVIKLVESAIR